MVGGFFADNDSELAYIMVALLLLLAACIFVGASHASLAFSLWLSTYVLGGLACHVEWMRVIHPSTYKYSKYRYKGTVRRRLRYNSY